MPALTDGDLGSVCEGHDKIQDTTTAYSRGRINHRNKDYMKIYIAGPMTGLENFNRDAFNKMAEHVCDNGDVALNPAILPDGLSQHEYMDICMAMIRAADGIMLLRGWQHSPGARDEHALAEKLGLAIFTQ